jgi:hypothetical protein
LICTIIYIGFIIHYLITEVRSFYRLKCQYFRRFWSLIELGNIFCSCGCLGVFFWRYKESKRLSSLFEQTNGYSYINLQLAVYINDILTFLFGVCCFFASIRFIRLIKSDQRLSLFTRTLHFAAKELLSFAFMFSIVFMSFVALFHLLFISHIYACSTLLSTTQMLFEITLMKFDSTELIGASAVLGPVAFALFVLLVVFICLSMFLSIINDSFHQAQENVPDDPHLLTFMLNKFLRWTRKICHRSAIKQSLPVSFNFRFEKANG